MLLPLEGLTVISLEQAVAAPLCTRRLADAGARVIKVERPGGDFARGYDRMVRGGSTYFTWLNGGKESIALNLRDPADAALLKRMIAKADVFVHNMSPEAAARAGLGFELLSAGNPRLIVCAISGYGSEGPKKNAKAYDLLIQCETGLASITGGPESPGRVGISVADIACGSSAHAAILEALLLREKSGVGVSLSIALFDALVEWMAVPLLQFEWTGKAPERVGLFHPSIAPYGAYELQDGSSVVLSIQNEGEWQSFVSGVLGGALADDPRFAVNTDRVANRPALEEFLLPFLKSLAPDELVRRLDATRTAFAFVAPISKLSTHPHLRRINVETGQGVVSLPAPPHVWDAGRDPARLPTVNEHEAAIRAEFASAG